MIVRCQPTKHAAGNRMTERTDAQLIADCLAGRQSAWNELVERYSRLVYSAARRSGLKQADADDVHQNVFLLLYRKLADLRDVARLASWLLTTANRESWRLAAQRGPAPASEWETADEGGSAGDGLAHLERQHIVRQALRRLGGRDEQLLTALFLAPGEVNYERIAAELGMKVGSIGPTRARCFRKLEAILLEMGFDARACLGDGGA